MSKILDQKKVFIIAEAGINHNGDLALARRMVDGVKKAGADCIKFQTFKAEEFVNDKKLKYTYRSQGKKITESQYAMFKRYEFSAKQWGEIIAYCKKKDVIFSTTAQNPSDLELIFSLTDLPFIKVGSDDLTNLDLMKHYAKKGKPMIISAGMAYASEIKDAVLTIRKAGNKDITVLHCTSAYPTKSEEVNLSKISAIRDAFGVRVGFSDHTQGSIAAVAAVCLGARVIEKHFTLSHDLPGPDHWFSEDEEQLKTYIKNIRFIEKVIGEPDLVPTKAEIAMRKIARRSVIAQKTIKKGQIITREDLTVKRPGTGIPPKYLRTFIGKAARKNFALGHIFAFKDL